MSGDPTERRVTTRDGLTFRTLEQGDGTPVLLLHGFPDSADLWRKQLGPLAAAGFRAIAPDLRGFGESDRPEGVEQYGAELLVGDALAILDALAIERAHVVGHDWGAFLAWALAALAAERVSRLVAFSVGHPNSWAREAQGVAQRRMSWYMLMFNAPGLAEEALAADGWRLFREFVGDTEDADRQIGDLARPGALTAGLNWYRANVPLDVLVAGRWAGMPTVACDAMGVWSDGDVYCGEAQMAGSADYVVGSWRYERVEGADHWLPVTASERVSELLVDFLADRP